MFGTNNLDLQQVLRYQDDLRRETAQRRMAAKPVRRDEKAKQGQTRRVFGLRLSFA